MDNTKTKTKRQTNRERRRATIIDIATRLFLEQGYAGSAMSKIANIIGGSKATLWSYFPSKHALFTAVVDNASNQLQHNLDSVLHAGLPQRATLEALCHELIVALSTPEAISLQRVIISESARFPPLGQIFHERGPRRILDKVSQFLAREMEMGRMRAEDPQEAALQLIGMIQLPQMYRLWSLQPLQSNDESLAYTRSSVAAFIRAYASS